jgi:hypothetical protein
VPDPLQQKKENRFKLLRKLYEVTNGVPERHSLNIRQLGRELDMEPAIALDTFEYLKGEGLAKWMALGGFGTITHWGVREVEEALEGRQTAHFPANIVIVTGSPGANVVAGTRNVAYQEAGVHSAESAVQLRDILEQIGLPLPSEGSALLDEVEKPAPDKVAVALTAQKLAQVGAPWKTALMRFAETASAGLVVEAIKFALGA